MAYQLGKRLSIASAHLYPLRREINLILHKIIEIEIIPCTFLHKVCIQSNCSYLVFTICIYPNTGAFETVQSSNY
jgi:hypothetical protein